MPRNLMQFVNGALCELKLLTLTSATTLLATVAMRILLRS